MATCEKARLKTQIIGTAIDCWDLTLSEQDMQPRSLWHFRKTAGDGIDAAGQRSKDEKMPSEAFFVRILPKHANCPGIDLVGIGASQLHDVLHELVSFHIASIFRRQELCAQVHWGSGLPLLLWIISALWDMVQMTQKLPLLSNQQPEGKLGCFLRFGKKFRNLKSSGLVA